VRSSRCGDPVSRTTLAVVFGGRSTEHAISCVSAGSILAAVDRERYDVVAVGITPEGRWVLAPDDPALLALSGRELPSVKDGQAVALPGDPTVGGLVPLEVGPDLLGRVDVVFPVLHGPFGEDGTVQGLLEMAGVPYVGSGVLSSAAAMDKAVARVLLTAAGLAVTPAVVVRASRWADDLAAVVDEVRPLGLPLFVKPARGGSSIGISRVTDLTDLPRAVDGALRCDPKVLVEAAVAGREVECGILEDEHGRPQASVPAEVRVVGDYEFYDFEAKYLDAATELDVPADLPGDVTERLQALSRRAYEALDCEGLARVDFFVLDDGGLVVNEVNTMPGFTPTSMYPRMWAASGVDYPTLVDRLVQAALRRGTGLR
jgi:D-alanine-D-alanine ligase